MNKFKNINYPVFGLYKKPYNISYDHNKIYVIRAMNSHKETVDDKSFEGDYFARLIQITTRLKFDCTCSNLQQLIFENPKWLMDANANPVDLSNSLKCKVIKRKINKTKQNLVWFNSISYPFTIPTNEILDLKEDIYAIMVQVDNEWFIKSFTDDNKPVRNWMIL